jgi:hypothetical protein
MQKIASFLLIFPLLVGCAASRQSLWQDMEVAAASAQAMDQALGLEKKGDDSFLKRDQEKELKLAIAWWEQAAALAPSAERFTKLARAHYLLADGFYGLQDLSELRDAHFTKGLEFAEKALKLNAPVAMQSLKDGESFSNAIAKAPKAAVPTMYWYAVNLGKWATSQGFLTRLKYKDDIKATMMRVKELDPDYFHAGPWRYFGAYEAVTAGLAGGDLGKSEENFKTASQNAPQYLGTKVLWAEQLCIRKQDKASFQRLLNEVIESAIDASSDVAPENRIEQAKAKKLLAQIDTHF